MTRRRQSGPGLWREWLWSALLGIGLALVLILWLGSARTPKGREEEPVSTQEERSLGFEFTVRFRILLPKGKDA